VLILKIKEIKKISGSKKKDNIELKAKMNVKVEVEFDKNH